ncbi:acyltransferase [Reinekea blandensis]|uniref:acyltransferase n=1 Tax=Reinekea blandensis TaxID=374838 RepID=UPI000320EE93|nr:acyltransferase [Reinekea blandensis]
MQTLTRPLLGVLSILALILYTLFLGVFLFIAVLFRLLLPGRLARRWANPMVVEVASIWVSGLLGWMQRVLRIRFVVNHDLDLHMNQWNLIIANHQSWIDIFALLAVTLRRLPILKFFIKKQLIWVPIAGVAWWALDYPFMSRHSREYLKKHPEKAGQDLETTRRACEKFSDQPTTIVNFLEGTRLTPEKHAQQSSPYRHLLKPKSGGIAFAIQALGEKFDTIIDTTIHYQGKAPNYWDMACGRVGTVTLNMRKLAIPPRFQHMDYSNNREDRAAFQRWVSELWQEKDAELEALEQQSAANGRVKSG